MSKRPLIREVVVCSECYGLFFSAFQIRSCNDHSLKEDIRTIYEKEKNEDNG